MSDCRNVIHFSGACHWQQRSACLSCFDRGRSKCTQVMSCVTSILAWVALMRLRKNIKAVISFLDCLILKLARRQSQSQRILYILSIVFLKASRLTYLDGTRGIFWEIPTAVHPPDTVTSQRAHVYIYKGENVSVIDYLYMLSTPGCSAWSTGTRRMVYLFAYIVSGINASNYWYALNIYCCDVKGQVDGTRYCQRQSRPQVFFVIPL